MKNHIGSIRSGDCGKIRRSKRKKPSAAPIRFVKSARLPQRRFNEANPDYRRNYDAAYNHRPFVIVDSEGCRIKEPPTIKNGVGYPAHASFLWMAGYWQRTRPGTGIGAGNSPLHHSGTEGANGNFVSLEHPNPGEQLSRAYPKAKLAKIA